jgi:hypothetical protein
MPVLKGALVSFIPLAGLGSPLVPNVITFQFNPETITHAWTEAVSPQPPSDPKVPVNPLAVTGVPGETFSFTLMLDSDEQIADGSIDPVGADLAGRYGAYPTLAALELLQFPNLPLQSALVGQVSAANSAQGLGASAADSSSQSVPVSQVPVVLFIWGSQRIVPVRVTALSVTEKLFDTDLRPTQAEAQITLTVLTPDVLASIQGSMKAIGTTAYQYTQGLREAQATANLDESAMSIIGMLPTGL